MPITTAGLPKPYGKIRGIEGLLALLNSFRLRNELVRAKTYLFALTVGSYGTLFSCIFLDSQKAKAAS